MNFHAQPTHPPPSLPSRYCIGEAGLYNALYEAGLTMNDVNPDYVVVGETHSYGWEMLEKVRREA